MSSSRYRLPPLAALRPFELAARHESFKRAADELHLSQAAISRQIRALEADVGTPLFTRHHRRVALTAEGRSLADAVIRGLAEIGKAADVLRARRPEGEVVVLAELYVAMYWLVPLLPAFHAVHPDLTIQVSATTEPVTRAGDRFDLAVQSTDRPAGTLTPLFTAFDDIFPICAPGFAASGSMTLEELAEQPLFYFREPPDDFWLNWPQWFMQVGVPIEPAAPAQIFDSYPVMVQAVLAGHGIGLGWGRGLGSLLERGDLVTPTRESLHQPAGMAVYSNGVSAPSTAVGHVADWLRQRLNEPTVSST
ncbi:LysR substrate-binding domain-containing protein [Salinisphaera sp. SWV1]|uniref:LysR substrate-binding domain-containing protein n=1 Tax=Salinisphaera sp. SWV1 TaxID=3454139 RepID=UPI003F82CD82